MATSSSSYSSSYSSDVSDMPKNADYYLPPIVRSLGEDVIVNKVRLQCKSISDGRYLYTYTMDLAQDHPHGVRTERSTDTDCSLSRNESASRYDHSKKSRSGSSCQSEYSVSSFRAVRPEGTSLPHNNPVHKTLPPQTSVSVYKPSAVSPKIDRFSLTDATMCSVEEKDSAEIRQEVTITFYLFGQTERGEYFRLRLFDAFLARTSIRRVLKTFASATDHTFRDFIDHLYIQSGTGENLKNTKTWQKLPRDNISMNIRDLCLNNQPFSDEFVVIVDLIGVHGMSPAARRAIGKN